MFKSWLSLFNLTLGKFSEQREIFDMITYASIGFIVHFFFKNPQLLLGITIDTLLVLAALNLRGKKLIPIIVLPSIGAVLGSFVFHNMTFMIFSFVPVLWLSNTLFIFIFKWVYLERKVNFFLTLFIAAVTNYLFLTLTAYAFVVYGLAPEIFMVSMGTIQLFTAIAGGILAFLIVNVKLKK
jgi:hypothetical protein